MTRAYAGLALPKMIRRPQRGGDALRREAFMPPSPVVVVAGDGYYGIKLLVNCRGN